MCIVGIFVSLRHVRFLFPTTPCPSLLVASSSSAALRTPKIIPQTMSIAETMDIELFVDVLPFIDTPLSINCRDIIPIISVLLSLPRLVQTVLPNWPSFEFPGLRMGPCFIRGSDLQAQPHASECPEARPVGLWHRDVWRVL
jgi:hypothetical protein